MIASVFALGALLTSCTEPDPTRVRLTVFAASSLTEAFEDLVQSFEAEHPTAEVLLTLAGSQVLRLQIEHGASADVFASAHSTHVAKLVQSGRAGSPIKFASNELALVVPRSNPANIGSFEQLNRARQIVIGTDNAPIGRYTREMLHRARAALGDSYADAVERSVVSTESNSRLVRAKVDLGEADAAVVYRTDALASNAVRIIRIPDAINTQASYHIIRVAPAAQVTLAPPTARSDFASRFIDYIGSREGQRVLARHGFEPR
ncbi:MAG: molybdate ABC transporter substrate-binding protein [Myxococcota bacterium]